MYQLTFPKQIQTIAKAEGLRLYVPNHHSLYKHVMWLLNWIVMKTKCYITIDVTSCNDIRLSIVVTLVE